MGRRLERARERLGRVIVNLEAISPLAVLARGYSVTRRADSASVITDAHDLATGDLVRTNLAHGQFVSRVESTRPEDPAERPS